MPGRSGVNSTACGDRRITRVGQASAPRQARRTAAVVERADGRHEPGGSAAAGAEPTRRSTPPKSGDCSRCGPGITDLASIVFADEGEILAGRAPDPDLLYNQIIRPWKSRLALLYVERRTLAGDLKILGLTLLGAISRDRALAGVAQLLDSLERRPAAPPHGAEARAAAGLAAAGGRQSLSKFIRSREPRHESSLAQQPARRLPRSCRR